MSSVFRELFRDEVEEMEENNMFFAQSIDLLKTAAHLCGSPKIII